MLNEALGLLEFQDITRNRSALLGASRAGAGIWPAEPGDARAGPDQPAT